MTSRSFRTRRGPWLAGFLALGLVLGACSSDPSTTDSTAAANSTAGSAGGSGAAAPNKGGTLTVGLQTSPKTLDPNAAGGQTEFNVMRQVFDSLVYEESVGKYTPWLAQSWTISPDGTVYTFKLRTDVTFQDGTKFDAAAVCFNFDRIVKPETASRIGISALGPYKSCAASDAATAVVTFKSPYPSFLAYLANYLYISSPAAVAKEGANIAQHPVGTGPFAFESWTLNSEIVLKRNDAYNWAPEGMHSGSAYLDKIVYRLVPNDTTRVGSLQSGDLDAVEVIPAQMVAGVKADANVKVDAIPKPGAPYVLFINQDHAPWNDLKARTALRDAIDVKTALTTIYFDVYARAWGPLSPTTAGYDKSVENSWQPDLAKANQAFDELGWTKGPDGIRVKDGKKLSIVFLEEPNRDKRSDLAEFIAQGLRQNVGIEVTTTFLAGAAWTAAAQPGKYDVTGGSLGGVDGSVLKQEYDSSRRSTPDKLGYNLSNVNSPELDKLLADAQAAPTTEASDPLYAQAQKWILDNVAVIPIYVNTYVFAYQTKVKDLKYDRMTNPLLFDVHLG